MASKETLLEINQVIVLSQFLSVLLIFLAINMIFGDFDLTK